MFFLCLSKGFSVHFLLAQSLYVHLPSASSPPFGGSVLLLTPNRSYFLCLETKKVSKENSRLQIILGFLFFSLLTQYNSSSPPVSGSSSNSIAYLGPPAASFQTVAFSQNSLRPFEIQIQDWEFLPPGGKSKGGWGRNQHGLQPSKREWIPTEQKGTDCNRAKDTESKSALAAIKNFLCELTEGKSAPAGGKRGLGVKAAILAWSPE